MHRNSYLSLALRVIQYSVLFGIINAAYVPNYKPLPPSKCYLDPTGSNATRAECSRIKDTNPQLLIKNKGLIAYPGHPNWFISCNHEEGTTAPCMMCAQGTVFSNLCGHCTHPVNVTESDCNSAPPPVPEVCEIYDVFYGCADRHCYFENQYISNIYASIAYCQCTKINAYGRLFPICKPTPMKTQWKQVSSGYGFLQHYKEYFEEYNYWKLYHI